MIARIVIVACVAGAFAAVIIVFSRTSSGSSAFRRRANILFPLSQISMLSMLFYSALTYEWPTWLFVLVVLLSILCVVSNIALLEGLREAEGRELVRERIRLLEEQTIVQNRYYERLSQELEEARFERQRIADELSRVESCLRVENPDCAILQLGEVASMIGCPSRSLCEHQVVDALVGMKMESCAEVGVKFTCSLDVPDVISLSDVELCAVFSNIIDNAINACKKVEMPDERFIDLRARREKGYLVVTVCNSCISPSMSRVRSRRRASVFSEHGWGLVIVENIVVQHNGSLRTRQSGSTFRTSIMLKLDE